MDFDDILLALIARRPRSGYELKKWLDVEGVFIRANADQSQIYRTLRRLQKKEFIRHEVVRRGGPDSKVYQLTEDGAEYLLGLADTAYVPPARWQEADFNARLLLLGPIAPQQILQMIDIEVAFRREQIKLYRGRPRPVEADSDIINLDESALRELYDRSDAYGRAATDHWLDWLTELRARWAELLDHGS